MGCAIGNTIDQIIHSGKAIKSDKIFSVGKSRSLNMESLLSACFPFQSPFSNAPDLKLDVSPEIPPRYPKSCRDKRSYCPDHKDFFVISI